MQVTIAPFMQPVRGGIVAPAEKVEQHWINVSVKKVLQRDKPAVWCYVMLSLRRLGDL